MNVVKINYTIDKAKNDIMPWQFINKESNKYILEINNAIKDAIKSTSATKIIYTLPFILNTDEKLNQNKTVLATKIVYQNIAQAIKDAGYTLETSKEQDGIKLYISGWLTVDLFNDKDALMRLVEFKKEDKSLGGLR